MRKDESSMRKMMNTHTHTHKKGAFDVRDDQITHNNIRNMAAAG